MSRRNYLVVSADGQTSSVPMSSEDAIGFAMACVEDTDIMHYICRIEADVTPVTPPPIPAPLVTWRPNE